MAFYATFIVSYVKESWLVLDTQPACRKRSPKGGLFHLWFGIMGWGDNMLVKNECNREMVEFVSLEEMVPANHLLRKIDAAINFNKIYDFMEDLYCEDNGRPSIDSVVLFKIVLIQHIYGIPSLRRTLDDVNMNMAYTNYRGLTQITNWVKLKFAAMNLKKLATWRWKQQKGGLKKGLLGDFAFSYPNFYTLQRANPILP